MVIPRSFSMSLESITRSSLPPRVSNVPDCSSSLSTRVVLPWSTCAIIAILRNFSMLMFITQIITRKSGLILYTKSCSTAQNRPLEFKRGVLSPNNAIDESLCSIIFSTDVTIRRIKGQFSIEAEINHAIKAPALIQ